MQVYMTDYDVRDGCGAVVVTASNASDRIKLPFLFQRLQRELSNGHN